MSKIDNNVLTTAKKITEVDRQRYYGHPLDNHSNTAAFWSDFLCRKYSIDVSLTARDVCMMMILLKISRDANKENLDNLVDICGYARNAQMVEEEAVKRDVKNNTRKPKSRRKDRTKSEGSKPKPNSNRTKQR